MPGESLSFPIFAPDHASKNIREVGDAAAKTAAKLDIAAVSAKLWNDTTIKSGKAADTALASMKAHTAATALFADAERVLAGEATKTTKLMADQGREFDKVGKSAEKAAGAGGATGLSALIGGGGGGGGGMAALIGAGVALAPVLVTVGTGLAGFGAAAYGVAAPILKAAQATGGLQANMAKLDPEQRKVAQGLLGLGNQFDAFEKALRPQVLGVFNQGIKLAGHLLHDVQPVTKATGIALGTMLGQIDKEFQSGTWQSFFGFMARTAGPDIALLSKTFINLTATLPPLLKLLQPVATDILAVSAATTKLVAAGATAGTGLDKTAQHENVLAQATDMLRTVLFAPGVGLYHALQLIGVISSPAAKGLAYTGYSAATASQKLAALNKAADAVSISWGAIPAKAQPATDVITRMAGAAQAAFVKAGPATDAITRLGTNSQAAAGHVAPFTDAITMTAKNEELASKAAGPLSDAITNLAIPAKTAADRVQSVADAVKALNTQESTALATANAYATSMVTSADDAAKLAGALKTSHDKIGLHTQAQRNSFRYANTYITDLGAQATAAIASGHGTDRSIAAIRNGLPILDSAKTKSKAYWQEVKALVGWLGQLQRLKNIHESVLVSGSGHWTVIRPGKIGLPGGTAGGPFPQATGGLIPGTGNRDTFPALLTPGEAVVPKRLVPAVAPFLKANAVPGFAAGGVVPGYAGSVSGLAPWAAGNMNAQVSIFEQAIAAATFAGMQAAARAAQRAQTFGGGLGRGGLRYLENLWMSAGGPGGGTAHVAAAIALAESGGSPIAHNASGASGLWQILGQVVPGNIFNPFINALNAVKKYRDAGGFSPWVTFTSGAYQQFMARGGRVPGFGGGDRWPALLEGGEAVVPKHLTPVLAPFLKAHGVPGFAQGGLAGALAGLTPGSANLWADVRRLLAQIAAKYTGTERRRLDRIVEEQARDIAEVRRRIRAMDARDAARRAYAKSVTSGLSGFADLSTMTLGGGFVGGKRVSAAGALQQQLGGSLSQLHKFASVLRRLDHLGLPASLLRQIVALGPGPGTQWGQELLSASPGLLKKIAATERDIGISERNIGRVAGRDVFGNTSDARLERQFRHERRALVNIERMIVADRTDILKVAQQLSHRITAAGFGS